MSHYNDRFKDAPWYEQSTREKILVVGLGGIGSNALYCLTKTIPAIYYILDNDKVEEHNIGTQFFARDYIKISKTEALTRTLNKFIPCKLNSLLQVYSGEYLPITITALDNMKTRRQVFNIWQTRDDREILIDGRLRANLYEIYVVTKDREEEYEKTLFEDSDVSEGPCTFKQTAYFAMLIGARITQVLVNYLTNKYVGEELCVVPFKINEFGDMFIFEQHG